MSSYQVKKLETISEIIASERLCQSSYLKKYNFDYQKIKSYLPHYQDKISFGYFIGNTLISSITGVALTQKIPLPSEILFNFKIPEGLLSKFQIMEIGRLCKNFEDTKYSTPRFEDIHKLLQNLVVYAGNHGYDYLTASLHPSISFILSRIFKIPFQVLYSGQPHITTLNECLLPHTGTYTKNGLVFVGVHISKIQNSLNIKTY